MEPRVLTSAADVPGGQRLADLEPGPLPLGVLVCAPDHFDVLDVKNAHMAAAVGTVDRGLARDQWESLLAAFERVGLAVHRIEPTDACEDMVFCANQTFTGVDAGGRGVCVLGHMRHASRRREVPAFEAWFRDRGDAVLDPVPDDCAFEGGGDALWHPGRRLIWAGHGFRTDPPAHAALADALGAPVASLALVDEHSYHLDTCLCLLDEGTALVRTAAFDDDGLALIRRLVPRVVEADEGEAATALACNAAAVGDGGVVIDSRAGRTIAQLADLGYDVVPVDTGEFLKSGGSVFCLKQWLYC